MALIPRDAKYVGRFKEDRDGSHKIVDKWEYVSDVAEFNAEKEALAAKILAQKIDESTPLGKIEIAPVEAIEK